MIILREGTGASSRNVQTILVPRASILLVSQKDRSSRNENACKPTEHVQKRRRSGAKSLQKDFKTSSYFADFQLVSNI